MSWYKQSMPLVKNISSFVDEVCKEIKTIDGVKSVYLFGSYAANKDNPKFAVKDIDVIAVTEFNSGDLLAIDNSKYSALKIRTDELEEEGFFPQAVSFTRKFLSYDVDHWATTEDNKVVHWGLMPDSKDDWLELHTGAEKEAESETGVKRARLFNVSEEKRKTWKLSYDRFVGKFLKDKSIGWCLSDHNKEEIISTAMEVK